MRTMYGKIVSKESIFVEKNKRNLSSFSLSPFACCGKSRRKKPTPFLLAADHADDESLVNFETVAHFFSRGYTCAMIHCRKYFPHSAVKLNLQLPFQHNSTEESIQLLYKSKRKRTAYLCSYNPLARDCIRENSEKRNKLSNEI